MEYSLVQNSRFGNATRHATRVHFIYKGMTLTTVCFRRIGTRREKLTSEIYKNIHEYVLTTVVVVYIYVVKTTFFFFFNFLPICQTAETQLLFVY